MKSRDSRLTALETHIKELDRQIESLNDSRRYAVIAITVTAAIAIFFWTILPPDFKSRGILNKSPQDVREIIDARLDELAKKKP